MKILRSTIDGLCLKRIDRVFRILFLTFVCLSARAQSYSIDWFTIDGGGGTSTGGVYALSGTIGQPDVGISSGGNYTLQGGFWPGVLVVPPTGDAPALFIQLNGANVALSWSPAPPGFVLEVSDNVSSTAWNPAPSGSTNPVTLSVGSGAKFYRLRKP
jgi:hypothetical protein